MKKQFILIALAFSILLVAATGRSVMAQNLTTNASNTAGNMSVVVNQTGSEMAKNMSNAVNNTGKAANQTMSEAGKNVSNAMSNASNAVNQTVVSKPIS